MCELDRLSGDGQRYVCALRPWSNHHFETGKSVYPISMDVLSIHLKYLNLHCYGADNLIH
jgi:hypothetical protein